MRRRLWLGSEVLGAVVARPTDLNCVPPDSHCVGVGRFCLGRALTDALAAPI